jgi:Helix-turn-helix domain
MSSGCSGGVGDALSSAGSARRRWVQHRDRRLRRVTKRPCVNLAADSRWSTSGAPSDEHPRGSGARGGAEVANIWLRFSRTKSAGGLSCPHQVPEATTIKVRTSEVSPLFRRMRSFRPGFPPPIHAANLAYSQVQALITEGDRGIGACPGPSPGMAVKIRPVPEHASSHGAPQLVVTRPPRFRGPPPVPRGLLTGLTMDVATAAQILGVSRGTGYALARVGRFPVNVVRVGRRYVVPTAAMIRLLEAE